MHLEYLGYYGNWGTKDATMYKWGYIVARNWHYQKWIVK